MYKKNSHYTKFQSKIFSTMEPLYDLIEIMGDHLIRVYEQGEKGREQSRKSMQPYQDRLITEALAEFFMTGKFQLRCPFDALKKELL
jgi:hypothetical protein